jgi:hypothetical protein
MILSLQILTASYTQTKDALDPKTKAITSGVVPVVNDCTRYMIRAATKKTT